MPAPLTRRERVHAATVEEIKAVARRFVAEQGPAFTLRAVARELGMAPSALYRYFDSRDALLTALMVDSYDDVGRVAEQTVAALPPGTAAGSAFLAVADAFREWAVARPHEYALAFGPPVPGYEPPEELLGHELRISTVLLELLHRALRDGEVVLPLDDDHLDPALRGAMAEVCEGRFAQLRPSAAALALACWAQLLGALSAEVFGHLPPEVARAPRALFRFTMQRHLASMGVPLPG